MHSRQQSDAALTTAEALVRIYGPADSQRIVAACTADARDDARESWRAVLAHVVRITTDCTMQPDHPTEDKTNG